MSYIYITNKGTLQLNSDKDCIFKIVIHKYPRWSPVSQEFWEEDGWMWTIREGTRNTIYMGNFNKKKIRTSRLENLHVPCCEADFKWSKKKVNGYSVAGTSRLLSYEVVPENIQVPNLFKIHPAARALNCNLYWDDTKEKLFLDGVEVTKDNQPPKDRHQDGFWYSAAGPKVLRVSENGSSSMVFTKTPNYEWDFLDIKNILKKTPNKAFKLQEPIKIFLAEYRVPKKENISYGVIAFHPHFQEMYSSSSWLRKFLKEELSS